MGRIYVGDVAMRVEEYGSGDPLLLINGIGASVEMWEPLMQHLNGRRVVAFDPPGVGQSPLLHRPRRMADLAYLVIGLLDALRLSHTDVLGYSWGGALAQEVARRAPARVRRLVLVSTVPGLGGQPPAPAVVTMAAMTVRLRSRWCLHQVAPLIYGGEARRAEKRELAPHFNSLLSHPPSSIGYAHQLFAILGWSSVSWLAQIPHKTLIMSGDDDPLVPVQNARLLARRIPGAQLHLVRGGGHLFLLVSPAVHARLIQRFLA